MYMKDILEKFVTIAKVIENVDASKYRAFYTQAMTDEKLLPTCILCP